MTIYCLLHENAADTIKREEIVGGDVKRMIHNLLSSHIKYKVSERAKLMPLREEMFSFYNMHRNWSFGLSQTTPDRLK